MKSIQTDGRSLLRHLLYPWYIHAGIALAILMASFAFSTTVSAAQTVPYKMNFQGRLTDSAGTPVADGLYNMQFRLFDAATSGTELWSETRETTSRVQVTNGLFSVQLGDVVSLDPADFNSSSARYFEIELPTTATATCSTASCATFNGTEIMSPRNPLGTSAYAMNADTIDGIDGASLAQVGTANTFTSTNTFNGTMLLGSTDSATKFVVKDNSNADLLIADTSATVVKVGTTATGTLSNVRLLSTSAEFIGTVRIGSATNGIDISSTGVVLSGTARATKSVTISPEYPSATFTGDGTSNIGTLSSDFCSDSGFLDLNSADCAGLDATNYYQWENTQATVQDYDIYVRYRLPSNYEAGSMTNLSISAWGTSTTTEKVILSMYDVGALAQCSISSNAVKTNSVWTIDTDATPVTACSGLAASGEVIFKIHLEAGQNNKVRAGDITFTYRTNKL